MADESHYSERIDRPTPAGGIYSVAYFSDAEGRRCTKADAHHIEIAEFDEHDNAICRTHMIRTPKSVNI